MEKKTVVEKTMFDKGSSLWVRYFGMIVSTSIITKLLLAGLLGYYIYIVLLESDSVDEKYSITQERRDLQFAFCTAAYIVCFWWFAMCRGKLNVYNFLALYLVATVCPLGASIPDVFDWNFTMGHIHRFVASVMVIDCAAVATYLEICKLYYTDFARYPIERYGKILLGMNVFGIVVTTAAICGFVGRAVYNAIEIGDVGESFVYITWILTLFVYLVFYYCEFLTLSRIGFFGVHKFLCHRLRDVNRRILWVCASTNFAISIFFFVPRLYPHLFALINIVNVCAITSILLSLLPSLFSRNVGKQKEKNHKRIPHYVSSKKSVPLLY
jgi:hypothetical protein